MGFVITKISSRFGKTTLGLFIFSAIAFASANESAKDNTLGPAIELSKNCPPGFKKVSGRCSFRSLYLQYDSLYNKGVGGLKSALPKLRDGFSPEQIDLGRYLFFDPLLSVDNTLSCASCHQPKKGFSDGKKRAIGHNGEDVGRASPSLWNVGFLKRLFWDARANSLEEQMQGPLFSEKEMNTTPEILQEKLNKTPAYVRLFRQAYPGTNKISLAQIYTSIAAFESTLISLNSRYDQYAHGYKAALSPKEIQGMNIFRSFVARCAECHTPPLFTNQEVAVIGSPEPDNRPLDPGAAVTFNNPELKGAFKVPSLRNIAHSAPYMHSGGFDTLEETITFYTKGRGHAVPKNEKLLLHWHIWEPNLSNDEIDRLVDFLKTLDDQSFVPTTPIQLPSGLDPLKVLY